MEVSACIKLLYRLILGMGIKKMNSFLNNHNIYKKYGYINEMIKDNGLNNDNIIIELMQIYFVINIHIHVIIC